MSASAWIRPLRLWCGLIMFAFLLCHFSNHALGLVSLQTMEDGRAWLLAPWRYRIVEVALLLSLLIHWLLGLWLLFRRRTLRMPAWEAVQIIFGLAVPPLLVYHAVGMYQTYQLFGNEDLYTRVILHFWVLDPMAGLRQFALLVVAWVHGCMGLHFWLRIRPWYSRLFPVLLTAVVLIPTLSVLGATQAGREVSKLAGEPGYVESLKQSNTADDAYSAYGSSGSSDPYASDPYAQPTTTDADAAFTPAQIRDGISIAIWSLLALALGGRLIRGLVDSRKKAVSISYQDGTSVRIPVGWTLLEASRSARLPHASVCGGRARCSTCRVRIAGDPNQLPAPTSLEKKVLERINAAPNVRLACQLRPSQDLAITPLLPVAIGAGNVTRSGNARGGEESEVAILFADLRGFTRVAEHKLPYDVVFLLNRYFEAVGGAVADAGGIANQYTGDGVMALFGVNTESDVACRQALEAAGEMIARIESLSETLGGELETPLRLGIGIHIGAVVVGEMGYGGTRYLTAVGDTVNTTSRLESLTKEYACELIVSEQALQRAGVPAPDLPHHELTLRNREEPLRLVVVQDARSFATRTNDSKKSFAT